MAKSTRTLSCAERVGHACFSIVAHPAVGLAWNAVVAPIGAVVLGATQGGEWAEVSVAAATKAGAVGGVVLGSAVGLYNATQALCCGRDVKKPWGSLVTQAFLGAAGTVVGNALEQTGIDPWWRAAAIGPAGVGVVAAGMAATLCAVVVPVGICYLAVKCVTQEKEDAAAGQLTNSWERYVEISAPSNGRPAFPARVETVVGEATVEQPMRVEEVEAEPKTFRKSLSASR